MSNDLISRSELLRKMTDRTFRSKLHEYQHYQNTVKNMPIAYDVDKVIERLEILSESADDKITEQKGSEQYWDGFADGIDKAIKILKCGGIE